MNSSNNRTIICIIDNKKQEIILVEIDITSLDKLKQVEPIN